MLKYTVILLSFFIGYTQNNIETKSFFRPEFLTGIIPSNNSFKEKPQYVFGVSYAKQHHNTNAWQKYFKKPITGLSLYITNYSSEKLGYSVSILPFIDIPINKKQNLHAKFAIGSSYFNTKYHAINNPENKQISTNFTWAIQSALYYDFEINKTKNWQVGLVFFHHSNGHTKLPNQGLNSILLGVSTNLLAKKQESTNLKQTNTKGNKFGNFFVAYRFGLGYHSFVANDSKLKPIYTISAKGGILYKDFIKLSLGVNYRYYQHYYNYITAHQIEPYYSKPFKNATNIYLNVGIEALLGRIGIDWEGGLNIHKPFYKKHYELQNKNNALKYKLKKLFLGRLGLKLYAINTIKKPTNNFYIATHINSNLSQADFSEISIGFTHNLNLK